MCSAAHEATDRRINPQAPSHLCSLAVASLVGFGGNLIDRRLGGREPAPRRLKHAGLAVAKNRALDSKRRGWYPPALVCFSVEGGRKPVSSDGGVQPARGRRARARR